MSLCLLLQACNPWKRDCTSRIYGHAASGLEMKNSVYHDNSAEAIDYVLNLPNCSGVEVDLRMDANGQLWLYHDAMLDGETNGTGCLESSSTAYLETLHYKSFHHESLMPFISENLDVFQSASIFLDLKTWSQCDLQTQDLFAYKAQLLNLNLDTTRFKVITNDINVFDLLKNEFPVYLDIQSIQDLDEPYLNSSSLLRGICIRNQNISREEVNFLKSIHKQVVIYEVRSAKGIKQALKKNPHHLLTEDVKLTTAILF